MAVLKIGATREILPCRSFLRSDRRWSRNRRVLIYDFRAPLTVPLQGQPRPFCVLEAKTALYQLLLPPCSLFRIVLGTSSALARILYAILSCT